MSESTIPMIVGEHLLANVKVRQLANDHGQKEWSRFWVEGSDTSIIAKASEIDSSGIKVGEVVTITVTVSEKPDRDGILQKSVFLGGKKQNNKGSGQGNRSTYQPKTPAEIHAASLCGIIKSAIEHGGDGWEATAKAALAIYAQAIKSLEGGGK